MSSPNTNPQTTIRVRWQTVVGLLLVAAFLYVIVPHLGDFRSSLNSLHHIKVNWLVGALAASLITYGVAAGTYCLLAKRPLRYWSTVLVQIAGMFVNRLLPGGIGALSVNFSYLRRRRHSVAAAGSVIAVNNLCGFIGHFLLLGTVLLITPTPLTAFSLPHLGSALYWIVGVIVVGLVVILVWSRKFRSELYRTLVGVQKNIVNYRLHPLRLVGAVGLSITLTLLYAICLTCCSRALSLHLAFAQILLAMTASIVAGAVTPTPGGLLGAEAGLFAGLTAYGLSTPKALAVVLIYRLLTYWLPLLFGGVALVASRRLKYI